MSRRLPAFRSLPVSRAVAATLLLLGVAGCAAQQGTDAKTATAAKSARVVEVAGVPMRDANGLKDLADVAGEVAAAAKACDVSADPINAEMAVLSERVSASALPKGTVLDTYTKSITAASAQVEPGSCEPPVKASIARMVDTLVASLRSDQFRGWVGDLPK